MKILIAGATGAIGQPLIDLLVAQKQDVYGITQSQERAKTLDSKGAKSVLLDVLDREAVFSAIGEIRPTVVIDMLTRLPKEYTPEAMSQAAEMDTKIRLEGGANLQNASEAHGVERYIAQSSAFWYAPGSGLADEKVSFAFEASAGIAAGCHVYAAIEQRVLQSKKIDGTALRFGFFYGPGTWFYPGQDVAEQICHQKLPLIGKGQGIWNFVHIEDAAQAIVAALTSKPGIYNIVNDQPSQMREWLPAFAKDLGAPPPPHITEEEGNRTRGADSVYYATKLRGASNAKAKQGLNFKPRPFEWLFA